MRSVNPEQEIKIQAAPRPVSRPAAWGRMLATSALLSLSLSGLSGCASADIRKSAVQSKEEVKVEQTITKEKPHCSRASKLVTKHNLTRAFTAETCDNWNYVETYFDNHQFKYNSPIPITGDFHGMFKERKVILGDVPTCSNWIITGISVKTFRVYLITDVTSKLDTGEVTTYSVDTGVIAKNTDFSLKQLDTCGWDAKFTDSDGSVTMQITKEGDLLQDGKIRN